MKRSLRTLGKFIPGNKCKLCTESDSIEWTTFILNEQTSLRGQTFKIQMRFFTEAYFNKE